jgi:hypothetical protein
VVALNKISFYLSLKSLPKTDQSILIKNKISSLKFSKKSVRVNFNYFLKINELSSQEAGVSKAGVGGGNLEKENQNFFLHNLPDLVRKENLAPVFQIFLTIPFDFPHEIYKCKRRNL